MNLTQPALTKTIRLLESELGVDLFRRTTRGIEPSRYGDAFAPYAERVLAEFESGKKAIDALVHGKAGTLRVGADSYVLNELLPGAITHLLARFPDVSVEIASDVSERLIEATANGELDLCITSVSRRTKLSLLSTIELLQEDYAIVARRAHPLAGRHDVRLAEVAAYPWVHVGPEFHSASNLVPLLQANRIEPPSTIIEADSLAYVVAHLRNSDCLSFQPSRLINAGDLVGIHVSDIGAPPAMFRIVAGHSKGQPISAGARLLLTELSGFIESTEDLHPLMMWPQPRALLPA